MRTLRSRGNRRGTLPQVVLDERRQQVRRDFDRCEVLYAAEAGEAAFLTMRDAARDFDQQLNDGLTDADRRNLEGLLHRLAANAGGPEEDSPPWTGLAGPPPNPA